LPLGIPVGGISLILDDPDVSRGRSWCVFPFGCLSQLFELTFVPASPEGTAPRCGYIALRHDLSLWADLTTTVDFTRGQDNRAADDARTTNSNPVVARRASPPARRMGAPCLAWSDRGGRAPLVANVGRLLLVVAGRRGNGDESALLIEPPGVDIALEGPES